MRLWFHMRRQMCSLLHVIASVKEIFSFPIRELALA
jgi:hypothetical protein